MLTDEQFGQQLGARLRHETEDVHVAPDLMRTLRRRQVRRTWAIRTAIATPVAVAAAIAIVVTTAGQSAPGGEHQTGAEHQTDSAAQSTGSSSPVQVRNVAYVQAETIKALDQAAQYVIHATNTYDSGHYDEWTDKATQRYRNDVYSSNPTVPQPANGKIQVPPHLTDQPRGPVQLTQSHGVSGPEGNQTIITVDYELKKWWTGKLTDKRPPAEPDVTDADSIRKAIADGTLELLGTEKIDGLDTLHLRLFGPNRSYRIDIWVDNKSYLPVQETAAKGTGETGEQEFPAEATVTTKYSWLPRTEENLARLVLTPPPDFQHVK